MLSLSNHQNVPPPAFPAKAGIQSVDYRSSEKVWVPAFAGKEEGGLVPPLFITS